MNGRQPNALKKNQTHDLLHSEVQVRGHLVDRGSRTLLTALPVHVHRDKGIVRQASQRLFFSVLRFLGRDAKTRMNGYITPLTYDPAFNRRQNESNGKIRTGCTELKDKSSTAANAFRVSCFPRWGFMFSLLNTVCNATRLRWVDCFLLLEPLCPNRCFLY